jgi:hypothetical protein
MPPSRVAFLLHALQTKNMVRILSKIWSGFDFQNPEINIWRLYSKYSSVGCGKGDRNIPAAFLRSGPERLQPFREGAAPTSGFHSYFFV